MSTTKTPSPPQRVESFWIDVRDHMPDDEITVLVCTETDDVWMAWHEDGVWREVGDASIILLVTHWMDVPETPKRQS